MSEWSGFFNAYKVGDVWDRTYLADDFANFFAPLIRNGVFAGRSNSLQVIPSDPLGMSVQVSSGQAWISGYSYINSDFLSLELDPADGSLNRIDAIVLQWNNTDRKISAVCKKGTPALNANPPALQNDENTKELCIAEIDVLAGLTSIKQQHIRDTRANTAVCGWVTAMIEQADTSTLFKQWEAAYSEQYNQNATYLAQQKAAWEEFFSNIQNDTVLPIPSLEKAGNSIVVNSAGSGYELKPLAKRHTFAATLGTAWTGSGPYTQTVTVAGILAADTPHIMPVYDAANATAIVQKEAWSCVSKAEAVAGGIKFTCFEDKPGAAVPLQIEVIR